MQNLAGRKEILSGRVLIFYFFFSTGVYVTVCPKSLDPFITVSYNLVMNSWTYSMYNTMFLGEGMAAEGKIKQKIRCGFKKIRLKRLKIAF